MSRSTGQIDTSIVWAIVTMLISVAVGGIIFSTLHETTSEQVPKGVTTSSFVLDDGHFVDNLDNSIESPWATTEDDNTYISWDSAQEWANIVENAEDNSGLTNEGVDIRQQVTIPTYTSVKGANVSISWTVHDSDNLDNVDLTVTFDGTTVIENENIEELTDTTWYTESSDPTSALTSGKTENLIIGLAYDSVDNDVVGGHIISIDNARFNGSTETDDETIGEEVNSEAADGASAVFPLLILMVVIGVFVALIGVLREL